MNFPDFVLYGEIITLVLCARTNCEQNQGGGMFYTLVHSLSRCSLNEYHSSSSDIINRVSIHACG